MEAPRLYTDLSWIWNYLSPPDHYVEEVQTFVERFRAMGVPDGGSVLHLGSGGGSIDFNLKQTYRITGIDRSPNMIRIAKETNPEVEYIEGDIRSARINRTFDAVLSHDAIAYMVTYEDLLATYRTAAAHLNPGGTMIAIPEEVRPFFVQDKVTHDGTIGLNGISVTSIEVAHDEDPSDDDFECDFIYLIRENGNLTIETDVHTMGIHDLDLFLKAIDEAGFDAQVQKWGLSDIEEDYPIIVARKR